MLLESDQHVQEKIKILHVTFNMGIGGTEQVIRQIIENSDKSLFCHEILCIDGHVGEIGLGLQEKGIHVESIQKKPGTDLTLVRSIRRLLQIRSISVLHCHQYTPFFYGALGSVGSSTRVIFTEHGRFFPDRHHLIRRFINPVLSFLASKVIAISRSTAQALVTYEYLNWKKIEVIYNGTNDIDTPELHSKEVLLKQLNLSSRNRYIGTVSRLEPIKNQTMMINAFHQLKQFFPDLKLVLIGDGAMRQNLEKLVVSLGIEKDVVFTGFLKDPQCYISLFEIFLLSSFSEGTSMTLLEAMSLSKPCVVTDVGGNPEIVIDGETGLVVPSDDVDSFTRSIFNLLKDPELKVGLGKAARLRFEKYFTVSRMVANYQSLYMG